VGPTDPGDRQPEFGTAVSGPGVSAAGPALTTRDPTLDSREIGSDFEAGSQADFLLDAIAVPSVITNLTTYRSSRQLVADITIAHSSGSRPG
jgi:hypothetical protein